MDSHSESDFAIEPPEHWQSSAVVRVLADYPATPSAVRFAAGDLASFGCTATLDAIVEVATYLSAVSGPNTIPSDIIVVAGGDDNCSEHTVSDAILRLQALRAHVHVIALGRYGARRTFFDGPEFADEFVMTTRSALGQWRAVVDMTDGTMVLSELNDLQSALHLYGNAIGRQVVTTTILVEGDDLSELPKERRVTVKLGTGERVSEATVYDSVNTLTPLSTVDALVDEQIELLVRDFYVEHLDVLDSDFEEVRDSGFEQIINTGSGAVSRILWNIGAALRTDNDGVRAATLMSILARVTGERPPVAPADARRNGLFAFEAAWLGWWHDNSDKPEFSRWSQVGGTP